MGRFVVQNINYTTVSTYHLLDKETAPKTKAKTKGLLCQMLSFSKDWNYSETGLAKINDKDGRTSIRTCLKELEENGYLERSQSKSSGKLGKAVYTIYEKPKHLIKDIQFEETIGESSNVYRVVKVRNYKSIPNKPLRDASLSLGAKGILAQIFAFSDNYSLTIEKLQSLNSDGKDAIRTILKELIAAGYIERKGRERLKNGTLGEMIYIVYDDNSHIAHIDYPQKVSNHSEENNRKNYSHKNVDNSVDKNNLTEKKTNAENGSKSQLQPNAENQTTVKNGSKSRFQPKSDFPTTGYPTTDSPTTDSPTADSTHNKLINNQILNNQLLINQSIYQSNDRQIDRSTDDYENYKEIIKENIDYDVLKSRCSSSEKEQLDEIVNIMTEVVAFNHNPVKINGNEIPAEIVKSQFLKIDGGHIEYVMEEFSKNTAKIHNVRAYLISMLYNAKNTIDSYYQARVMHDLYGGD